MPNMSQPWKKRIRITLGIAVLLIVSCLIWAFFIEPNRLVVRQETIQIDQWPKELSGLRNPLIADIHPGGRFLGDNNLHEIVDLTNQQNPHLLVLLGDCMSSNSLPSRRVRPERKAAP